MRYGMLLTTALLGGLLTTALLGVLLTTALLGRLLTTALIVRLLTTRTAKERRLGRSCSACRRTGSQQQRRASWRALTRARARPQGRWRAATAATWVHAWRSSKTL
jgi:hypothetical protein